MSSMATLVGHAEPVQELAVNEERQHLISLSADKAVKIWDIKTYQCLQTLEVKLRFRPVNMITSMTFDYIRRVLLLGTRKLNLATFKSAADAETSHPSPISCVLFNNTFEIIASCDETGNVAIWDIETGQQIFRYSISGSESGKITAACFDDKQRRLIIASHSGAIKIWNFSNGQCLTEMQCPDHKETTSLLVVKPRYSSMQHSSIVSSGWSKVAYMWPDSKDEKVDFARIIPPDEYQSEKRHAGDITCMAHSPVHGLLVTGGADGSLFAWIYETGYPKHCFHEVDPSCLGSGAASTVEKSVEFVGFIEIEKILISGTTDQLVRVWDLTTGELESKFSAAHGEHETLTIGKVHETGIMVTADNRGNIKYWDIIKKSIKQKWIVAGHKDAVTAVEILIHKEGRYVLSGGRDKNVLLHSEEGICIGRFTKQTSWRLADIAGYNKKLAPPKQDVGFTSIVLEEEKALREETRKKKKVKPQNLANKNLRKYIAPFKQIDLSPFPVEKVPTNYDELYFELFHKKLDKKMKS